MTPSEFREDLDIRKATMNELSCSEESMTMFSCFDTIYQRVTDRRTDEQTDRQTSSLQLRTTCFSIADACKNLYLNAGNVEKLITIDPKVDQGQSQNVNDCFCLEVNPFKNCTNIH